MPPATQLFTKVTTATALASAVRTFFTMNIYTAGALQGIRVNYERKICTAL